MIWLTADEHYNHKNIIGYCNRPFKTVEAMNAALIEQANAVVAPRDIVVHLGDFAWDDAETILPQLHGIHWLVVGNHDVKRLRKWHYSLFDRVEQVMPVKWYGQKVWCSHYAHARWPASHMGRCHAFGHSHGQYRPNNRSEDVGVDAQNYAPISIEDFIERVSKKAVFDSGEQHA